MNWNGNVKAAIIAAVLLAVPAHAETLYVNSGDGLCIRSLPTTKSKVIDVLPFGASVYLADDDAEVTRAGWYRIRTEWADGYVCADYVQAENPTADMEPLGEWHITAYTWTGYPCANGSYPQAGYTIACNSLPFGTLVYIEGVGIRTVEDRGPASMGNAWADIYMDTVDECVSWGSQTRQVFLITDGGTEK